MAKERRIARRNPQGAFAGMQTAASRLELGTGNFSKRKLSGRALLGLAAKSAVAKMQVRNMLLLDPKFNIQNDAAFNRNLFRFLRSRKSKAPFSFAIVDLDNLKQLNSTKGYAAADKAIALLVEKISGIAKRHNGFAGRFGGDEFKICIPGKAPLLAKELNLALAEMKRKRLTFSGGIAGSADLAGLSPNPRVEKLNRVANIALNESKRLGRARVIVA